MKGYQFGTFKGVFVPSILTIMGVIMYLRLGWVLGNVGLLPTLLIVTASTAITFLTALSISTLATNMEIRGGGSYYIISRSLGIEAGAAIGVPLFLAKSLSISFYVSGFAESLAAFFPQFPVPLIGIATLVILTIIAYVSADLALKTQYIVFLLIALSLISFFAGSPHPSLEHAATTAGTLPVKLSFWHVFAVFFPAVTGIEAGLSMSGDLKDPAKSLPLGTIAAILVSYFVYMLIPLALSFKIGSDTLLINNLFILKDTARWPQLVLLGLWGASLSSVMGSLLGAPRTLQAMSKDGVFPRTLGRGFGKGNDPRIATAISFAIALAGIIAGGINIIAPILSMFFLLSYGLLNVCAFLEGLISSPFWRPKFRVNWIWSALGTLGCFGVSFMISPGATILALIVTSGIYYGIKFKSLNAYWGNIKYGILMLLIRFASYRAAQIKPDERTWKPNILVLSGSPTSRWYLIALADAIAHSRGFLTIAAIVRRQGSERHESVKEAIRQYLLKRQVPALIKIQESDSVMDGMKNLVKFYGFGTVQPNTIILGHSQNPEYFKQYMEFLVLVEETKRNLIVLKAGEGDEQTWGNHRIDVWWRRGGNNAGLMLALAHLLKQGPEWNESQLYIRTAVEPGKNIEEEKERLDAFIQKERINAIADVVIVPTEQIFEKIQEISKDAALVLLGIRPKDKEESLESYGNYYRYMVKQTQSLPTTAFVMAAEKINFDKIFKYAK